MEGSDVNVGVLGDSYPFVHRLRVSNSCTITSGVMGRNVLSYRFLLTLQPVSRGGERSSELLPILLLSHSQSPRLTRTVDSGYMGLGRDKEMTGSFYSHVPGPHLLGHQTTPA